VSPNDGAPRRLFEAVNYTFMVCYALLMALPVLYVVQLTFSGNADPAFRIWPRDITLENYAYVIGRGLIVRPLVNSVALSSSATLFSLFMTSVLAYALSRPELPARRFFNFVVVLALLLNVGFLPKYLLVRDLGLINTYWSIILTGAISSFNVILMRNYFQKLPAELFDTARIDGATEATVLVRIVLPLSLPVLATIALFYFVGYWNEYFDIILFITDRSKHTLQVILRSMIILEEDLGSDADVMLLDNVKYTTVVVALIPIMLLYPFLQKYFTKGILLGSVKG
jgi:putative aldouronate transport system permease protein